MVENTSQSRALSTAGDEEMNKAKAQKNQYSQCSDTNVTVARKESYLEWLSQLEFCSIVRVCFFCKRKV
jgi:hypothetical protein